MIFAEEPTGALDATTGGAILTLMRNAVERRGLTVVMVTHDPLAAARSDRLIVLREGRVIDDRATPDAGRIAAALRAASVTPEPVR